MKQYSKSMMIALAYLTLCVILIFIVIFSLLRPFSGVNSYNVNSDGELSASMDDGGMDPSGIVCYLANNTDGDIPYNEYVILQRKLLGRWWEYKCPYPDMPADIAYVAPGETVKVIFDVIGLYGKLPSGNYRIVIEYYVYDYIGAEPDKLEEIGPTKKYICCEFVIG